MATERPTLQDHTRIRPATSGDEVAMTELAVANDMFGTDEVGDLAAIFRSAVSGELEDHQWWMSVRPDGSVVAAAYVAPEPFADRVWNLYFIAVSPTAHGAGAGTQLMDHVEHQLRSAGEDAARVLIVETSSTDSTRGHGRSTSPAASTRKHGSATSTARGTTRSSSGRPSLPERHRC